MVSKLYHDLNSAPCTDICSTVPVRKNSMGFIFDVLHIFWSENLVLIGSVSVHMIVMVQETYLSLFRSYACQ